MPWTTDGRYYRTVNGKRQYIPSKNRVPVKTSTVRTRPAAAAPKPAKLVSKSGPSLGRTLLEGGGSALGSMLGPAGAAAGRAAGGAISSILGLGAYEIKQNVFLEGRLPMIVNDTPTGGTIIRHTEYMGDIITSSVAGQFELQNYFINPAQEGTFPWLSQIAANYEQYSFEGLLFQFRSTSADALNSVNTALGTVIMATNYDASDVNFTSKGEMLNYEYSQSCKPSDSIMHMIECAPNQTVLTKLYCRPSALPPSDDQRFYDHGNFQIATTGFQGTNVNIGELHCTYQVRLLKPKLHSTLGLGINYSRNTSAGVTAAIPLGNAPVSAGDNIGLVFTNTTITFPVSRIVETYWVYYSVLGTVAAGIVAPVLTITNGTQTDLSQIPVNATNSTGISLFFRFVTLANGEQPVLSFGVAGTFPGGVVSRLVLVDQAPNDLP